MLIDPYDSKNLEILRGHATVKCRKTILKDALKAHMLRGVSHVTDGFEPHFQDLSFFKIM